MTSLVRVRVRMLELIEQDEAARSTGEFGLGSGFGFFRKERVWDEGKAWLLAYLALRVLGLG